MTNTNILKIIMLGPSLAQQGGMANYERLFLNNAPSEVDICHITTHEEGSVFKKMLIFGKALLILFWSLIRERVDLAHIHVSERGSVYRKAVVIFIFWLIRKPVILHTHGAEFPIFYENLPSIIQHSIKWIFHKCQRLIVLSKSWKDFYTKTLGLPPEKVIVFYNPVKLPQQVPNRTASEQVNLLFLGRIGQRKGAFDLIRAFSLLPPECRNRTRLIMAGDGELEEARHLVKRLNLSSSITLPGWMDTHECDRLLAEADVFILPSYDEGLPLAMLEAMAWGLPVIVTPVGGIPEIVTSGETGFLINPGDIDKLSKVMLNSIANEDLRLSLGIQARKRVEPLDIKHHWKSFLDIYRSVSKPLVKN